MGFIYKITCTVSPKVYVGQTTHDSIDKRWKEHLQCAKRMIKHKDDADKIKNIQFSYLYHAMAYHGIHNFKIELIEEADDELLNEIEILWIAELNTLVPNGYNLTSGGLNFKHSDVTIKLMKQRKRELVEHIRNEKLQGLPAKTTYRNHEIKGEQIVFNNHELCKHKTFSSTTYGSYEAAKEAAIAFFQELERTGLPYVKPKKGGNEFANMKGFIVTPKGYRVNKVHKGKTYDKRFERKDCSNDENKVAALQYYNELYQRHDIYIKRIGFSLIRVHRIQGIRSAKADDQLLLQNLKWPIETIYCGARPTSNFDTSSSNLLTRWNQYSHITTVEVDECCLQNGYTFAAALPAGPGITAADYTTNFVSYTGIGLSFQTVLGVAGATVLTVDQLNMALVISGYPPLIGTFAIPATPTEAEIAAALPPVNCVATYDDAEAIFETITLTAQGIYLYNALPSAFFNQYVPYTYGNTHVQTPSDPGAYMITFNLYPGAYQPSGYINISRSREFYLNYHSTLVGSLAVPEVEVTVIAIALNFLLISDGSAVLRYAT